MTITETIQKGKAQLERVIAGKKSLTLGEAIGLVIAIILFALGYMKKIDLRISMIGAIIILAVFMTLF